MKRYLKVYLQCIKINFALLLTYRANLWASSLYTVFWGVIGIFNMYVITLRISSAYGWTRNELIILASVYPIFAGIFYMIFASNIGRIPDIIHRADLDLILAKPIDSQFLLSVRFIDFLQIIRVVVCLCFLIFFVHAVHMTISPTSVLISILLALAGFCIVYSMWFGVITMTLWFTNLSNLKDLLYVFMGTLRYPSNMFLQKGNLFFVFFLLFSISLTIPTKVLLQKAQIGEVILLVVLSILFLFASRKFWLFALRFYVSASS